MSNKSSSVTKTKKSSSSSSKNKKEKRAQSVLSIDQTVRRWMFHHCPKLHSWIIYQNIRSILDETEYKVAPGHNNSVPVPGPKVITLTVPKGPIDPKSTTPPETTQVDYLSHIEPTEIKYVHCAIMSSTDLYCLLETKDGIFTIENRKENLEDPKSTETDSEANPDVTTTEELKKGDILKVEKEDEGEAEKKAAMEVVRSSLTFYDSMEHFMKSVPRKLLKHLQIKKLEHITVDQAKYGKVTPAEWSYKEDMTEDQVHKYLDEALEMEQKPGLDPQMVLDLSYNFQITADHLRTWVPKVRTPTKLILNTCWRLRNPVWAKDAVNWSSNIKVLELINMPQLSNEMLGTLLGYFPNTEDLYLHQCQKIDIRVLLSIFCPPPPAEPTPSSSGTATPITSATTSASTTLIAAPVPTAAQEKLRSICLNNQMLVCQPNEYAGLITHDEWTNLRNYKLEKIFINSGNVSLDVIDYLKTSFVKLQNLILRDDIYANLRKNMNPGTLTAAQLTICSTEGKKFEIPRDFTIRNLLRNRYQSPYSEAMQRIMQARYDKDYNPQSSTSKKDDDDEESGSYEYVDCLDENCGEDRLCANCDEYLNGIRPDVPKNTVVCKV